MPAASLFFFPPPPPPRMMQRIDEGMCFSFLPPFLTLERLKIASLPFPLRERNYDRFLFFSFSRRRFGERAFLFFPFLPGQKKMRSAGVLSLLLFGGSDIHGLGLSLPLLSFSFFLRIDQEESSVAINPSLWLIMLFLLPPPS